MVSRGRAPFLTLGDGPLGRRRCDTVQRDERCLAGEKCRFHDHCWRTFPKIQEESHSSLLTFWASHCITVVTDVSEIETYRPPACSWCVLGLLWCQLSLVSPCQSYSTFQHPRKWLPQIRWRRARHWWCSVCRHALLAHDGRSPVVITAIPHI